jgi:hypothetical protein
MLDLLTDDFFPNANSRITSDKNSSNSRLKSRIFLSS